LRDHFRLGFREFLTVEQAECAEAHVEDFVLAKVHAFRVRRRGDRGFRRRAVDGRSGAGQHDREANQTERCCSDAALL